MDAEQRAEIEFISQPWDDLLDELVDAAREHLILVAPFTKEYPLKLITNQLSELPSDTRPRITILTDLDQYSLLQNTLEISAIVKFVEQVKTVSVNCLSSLHAKIYLADQSKAIVTSANLTHSGLHENTEYGVIIRDPNMVNYIHQDVISFLEKSEPVSHEELRKICKEIAEHPDFKSKLVPNFEGKVTPEITKPIIPEPDVEDSEYYEVEENSHIVTEEEREYFDAVDSKDWLRTFELEVGPYQSLSRKDTFHLAEAIQKGDKRARIELINRRLAKVIELAKHRLFEGLPLLDLIQEGAIGLIKAVDNFDLKKGHNFHGYGDKSIIRNIIRAQNKKSHTIHLPIYRHNEYAQHRKLLIEAIKQGNEVISMEQFALLINTELKDIICVLRSAMPPVDIDTSLAEKDEIQFSESSFSLDSEDAFQHDTFMILIDMLDPFGNYIPRVSQVRKQLLESAGLSNGYEMGLGDLMINEEVDVEKDTETWLMSRDLLAALSNLPEREVHILRMRFGLNEDIRAYTLKELGERLQVTRERVRQIEKQALNRLRNSSAAADLRAYLHA